MKSVEQLLEGIQNEVEVKNINFPIAGVGVVALRETVNLVALGTELDLKPTTHSKDGKLVWDIKATTAGTQETTARSHTTEEFTWHTDASFEAVPPRYFMLQVLRGDSFGGGIQSFASIEETLAQLDQETIDSLLEKGLRWRVPEEFIKDTDSRELPVLFYDEDGNIAWRYRAECIDKEQASVTQREQLDALEAGIKYAPKVSHTPVAGELLVVDNWHVLHKRASIKDKNRHLQRVRFE